MRLGKLFKGVVKMVALPVTVPAALSTDILSGGVTKLASEDNKFLTQRVLDSIEKDLDKV